MTKIGNKGFMMAEVVVVSVIVATTLVVLYTSVNRLTTAFNLRNKYYDLDCLNLAIAANDTLIKNGDIDDLLKLDSGFSVVGDNVIGDKNLYNDYQSTNIYFVKNINNADSTKTSTKDYFSYLKANYNEENNYYIVSELCTTEDNCFYYGLGVR